jgi:hypothetical protein
VDGGVDPEPLRKGGLCRIGFDPDDLAWADRLEDDPGQEPVATTQVEPAAARKAVGDNAVDLD